jgi:stringent starvation protein B
MSDDRASLLTSTRPYLIRAIREWAIDNGLTPQILVDASRPGVSVPIRYVQDGRIVLNIHDHAVAGISLENHEITFSARFGGTPHDIVVPVTAVVAIYARENNQGIFFQAADDDNPGGDDDPERPGGKRPHLKLVQ